MKKIISSLLFGLLGSSAMAQTAEAAKSTSIWDDPMIMFYVVAGFLFVVSLLVLTVALYMWQVLSILARKAAEEKAAKEGKVFVPEPGLLENLWNNLNAFQSKEKEATLVMDHNYDGITELDNHLPPWWKWLLYITIIWGGFYLLAYHVFDTLPLSNSEYETELAVAAEQAKALKAANPGPQIDEATVEVTTDAVALADGKQTFLGTCASCHRRDGGGDIGPNLTDDYWKHGGSIKDIFKVVKNGVPNTNMVAWGGVMSPEAIRNVSSYVMSLKGSNPENPKKPEGDLYSPDQATPKSDSTKVGAGI
jgi:cytochrome c oxidase cbb3-type subunit 3